MAGRDATDRAAPRPIKAIVLSITCFSIRVHSNRLVPSYARRAELLMNVWPERPSHRWSGDAYGQSFPPEASAALASPKNRGPDQPAPVISRAMLVSDR